MPTPHRTTNTVWAIALLLLVGGETISLSQTAPVAVSNPGSQHARWLEEEAAWIITDRERELFASLITQQAQSRFIEAFWERRDQDRLTPANEYRDEHLRRVDHANRRFVGESRPGALTERGRYHILLGPPERAEPFIGRNEVVSTELWVYTNTARIPSVPSRFNLLFYKQNDVGDYLLYNPLEDGPEALLRGGQVTLGQPDEALNALTTISIDLARAAMSVDLTEPIATSLDIPARLNFETDPLTDLRVRPSPNSSLAIARILESARASVDLDYLDGYRNYGNRVDADFSFKYIGNQHDVVVFFDDDLNAFIHYAVELAPEDMSFRAEADEGYITTFDVSLELRERDRTVSVQRSEAVVALGEAEFANARRLPFSYQHNLPALAGDYLLSIMFQNRLTGHYTVVEEPVHVPQVEDYEANLAGTILTYRSEPSDAKTQGDHRTFEMHGSRFHPATGELSQNEEALTLVTQLLYPDSEQTLRFSVEDAQGKTLETLSSSRASPPSDDAATLVSFPFDASSLSAGDYVVAVALDGSSGERLASRRQRFRLGDGRPRPGVTYRQSFATDIPGLVDLTLGQQWMMSNDLTQAEDRFRRAVEAENVELPQARWQLASVILFSRRADEALDLLLPLAEQHPDQIEVVEGLGFSYYLNQDCARAIPFLERALGLRPADNSLLNATGDCYQQVNLPQKALDMFRLSLSVKPDQPAVERRIEELESSRLRDQDS